MHLYSIIETVLYMFYEAIINKSVYSLTSMLKPWIKNHRKCMTN